MSFTVAHRGGTKDLEFEAYVRLLAKHNVKVDQLERVPEPGTHNRWLYVWPQKKDAEAFRDELAKTTRDKGWYVHELNSTEQKQVTEGPLGPISIYTGLQPDGRAFALHPQSRAIIRNKYPHAARVDNVFVGLAQAADWTSTGQSEDALYDQIALLLTGLSEEQLAEFGGFRVYDPAKEEEVYRRANLVNEQSAAT